MTRDVEILIAAAQFAAERHRLQRRKGDASTPYINHPIEVAHLLASLGGIDDVRVLAAAILHDTVEDTGTTAEELEVRFGAEVRALVVEVTDDKRLPKQERKRLQIAHASLLSDAAKLIKIADKICNVRDIAEHPPSDWTRERRSEYLSWAEQVVVGLRGCNADLEHRFDVMIQHAWEALRSELLEPQDPAGRQ